MDRPVGWEAEEEEEEERGRRRGECWPRKNMKGEKQGVDKQEGEIEEDRRGGIGGIGDRTKEEERNEGGGSRPPAADLQEVQEEKTKREDEKELDGRETRQISLSYVKCT